MMKVVVEVCRVFGNLTRQKQVRDYLTEQKGITKMHFQLATDISKIFKMNIEFLCCKTVEEFSSKRNVKKHFWN